MIRTSIIAAAILVAAITRAEQVDLAPVADTQKGAPLAAAIPSELSIRPEYAIFATATRRVGTNILAVAGEEVAELFKLPARTLTREASGTPLDIGKELLVDAKAIAVVVVVDDPGAPELTVIPGNRVAVVNVLAFSPEGTESATLENRIRKETVRAFCAVMGGGFAPIFSAEDLDALRSGVTPTALMAVPRYMRSLGFVRKLGSGSIRREAEESEDSLLRPGVRKAPRPLRPTLNAAEKAEGPAQ